MLLSQHDLPWENLAAKHIYLHLKEVDYFIHHHLLFSLIKIIFSKYIEHLLSYNVVEEYIHYSFCSHNFINFTDFFDRKLYDK